MVEVLSNFARSAQLRASERRAGSCVSSYAPEEARIGRASSQELTVGVAGGLVGWISA